MGRRHKIIARVEKCLKLDISFLFKNKIIVPGKNVGVKYILNDKNGDLKSSFLIESTFDEKEKFIRLKYGYSDRKTENEEMNYRINLQGVKSNLGKGMIYYFVCPRSKLRCRMLYLAYNSKYFMARNAYENLIYYDCQRYSKKYYSNSRYFDVKDEYDKIVKSNYRSSYNGKKTKSLKRLEKLKMRVDILNHKRLLVFGADLEKLTGRKYV